MGSFRKAFRWGDDEGDDGEDVNAIEMAFGKCAKKRREWIIKLNNEKKVFV
jgi:hypothetical protein